METLKTIPEKSGIDVRQRLLDFHARYYSASIMKLALVGTAILRTIAFTHTALQGTSRWT
jgi:insulysin